MQSKMMVSLIAKREPQYGWVEGRSYRGHPHWYWRRRMPRIDDQFLAMVFYIYPSQEAAIQGERIGGSGFLIGWSSEPNQELIHLYAVTNRHVVRNAQTPFIRLNTIAGNIDIIETIENEWYFHPDEDDVAVLPIGLSPDYHKFGFMPPDGFLTKDIIETYNIGPGDDAFLLGRFISHDGKQRNLPTVRFGNISMMPNEPVRMPDGLLQEAFLVETRSLGGYSGSPVVVEIPPLAPRPDTDILSAKYHRWLLGVDCGHLPISENVVDEGGKDHPEGWKVRSNSGFTAVVPAWKLADILEQKELILQREQEERLFVEESKDAVVLDSTDKLL